MKVYYYCSYTGSPVGYILGSLDPSNPPKQGLPYRLESSEVSPFIRSCFEHGMVRKAFGTLPTAPGYFLLAKKLTAREGSGVDAVEYYMNFALVTEKKEEFQNWFQKSGGSVQDIADTLKGSIHIDRGDCFGFTVRPEKLKELLSKPLRPLTAGVGEGSAETYFELASAQTDLDQLKSTLGLSETDGCFEPMNEKWFRFGKKKSTITLIDRIGQMIAQHWKVAAAVAAIVALIVAMRLGQSQVPNA